MIPALSPPCKEARGKGFITRKRSTEDERNLIVTITEKGEALKDQAVTVPEKMAQCTNLTPDENMTLYRILYKMLSQFEDSEK